MLFPIVNESRTIMDLSGVWEFQLDDGHGFENEWMKGKLPAPEFMAVPASYNDQKDHNNTLCFQYLLFMF